MRSQTRCISTRICPYAMLLMVGLLCSVGCEDKSTGLDSEIDLDPFEVMARTSVCADIRNNLFLIDHRLVFWDREGSCVDAGYAHMLFAGTVDSVLCEIYESVAGVITNYWDESYRAMFDTMVANLDQPKLGIGQSHSVQRIPF